MLIFFLFLVVLSRAEHTLSAPTHAFQHQVHTITYQTDQSSKATTNLLCQKMCCQLELFAHWFFINGSLAQSKSTQNNDNEKQQLPNGSTNTRTVK